MSDYYGNKLSKDNVKATGLRTTMPPVAAIGSPTKNPRNGFMPTYRSAPEFSSAPMVCSSLTQEPSQAAETRTNEQTAKHEKSPSYAEERVPNVIPRKKPTKATTLANWVHPVVTPLPKYYPLGRSTVLLKQEDFDMVVFCRNMVACFRALSIHAKFHDDPASVSLCTMEYVEMDVAVWRVEKGNEIAVEVIRSRGCSLTFHNYAQVILEAARGNTDAFESWEKSGNLNLKQLLAAEQLLADTHQDLEASWSETLRVTHRLVTKGNLDEVIAGLQSLGVLTDARKVGISTAARFGQAILLGQAPNEFDSQRVCEIHNVLMNLLMDSDNMECNEAFCAFKKAVYAGDDESLSDSEDEMEMTAGFRFNLALSIFSNAVKLAFAMDGVNQENKSVQAYRVSLGSVISRFLACLGDKCDALMSNLVRELGKAERQPHNASLCAKCLALLIAGSGTQSLIEEDTKARAIDAAELPTKLVICSTQS